MRQVASFPLSFTKYRAGSFEGFFPDKTLGEDLIIDPPFSAELEPVLRQWDENGGEEFDAEHFRCLIFQTEEGENNDDFISTVFQVNPYNSDLVGVLDHLAADGRNHLAIPPGKDEVHLILKYDTIKAGPADEQPFVMEHEFEHGMDSIHLHVYERNAWKANEFPMVLVIVPVSGLLTAEG